MVGDSFRTLGFSEEEVKLLDKLSEVGCINAISSEEATATLQKTMDDWICRSCRWYPPSSCDGKPCCACDPDNIYLNCYEKKEGVNG